MIVTWIILTGDLDNDGDFCNYVFVSEDCRIGCGPLLARVGDSNLNLHLPRLHPGAHSQHITNPEPLMEEIWLTN